MCIVTAHALERARSRWNVRGDIEGAIKGAFHSSTVVGDWMEGESEIELRLARDGVKALIVDRNRNTVLTVYEKQPVHMSAILRPEVESLHRKRIHSVERTIKGYYKTYSSLRKKHQERLDVLHQEIDDVTIYLSSLKAERDQILQEIEQPLREAESAMTVKKNMVKSLMNFI